MNAAIDAGRQAGPIARRWKWMARADIDAGAGDRRRDRRRCGLVLRAMSLAAVQTTTNLPAISS